MTSGTRRTLLSLAALLLLSALPVSSALAEAAYCDPQLGRDFDQQTDEVRMARMNLYYDCRLTQDSRFLQGKQRHMLTGIQRWQSRGSLVARTTLRTKRSVFDAELRTIHLRQRNVLDAEYGNQVAELDAARLPSNKAEIDSQQRELTAIYRTALAELRLRQRQEVSLLREDRNQCFKSVQNEIKQLASEDSNSVRDQFLTKSNRLTIEYQTLKRVQINQSINEYLAELPSGAIGTVIDGSGTITSSSGDEVDITPGSPVFMGDVVETGSNSGCTIVFVDRTSVRIGSDQRLEIDEYAFDPLEKADDEGGGFNILRGVFLFTSGLIGIRELSDVEFTPAGSGPRG